MRTLLGAVICLALSSCALLQRGPESFPPIQTASGLVVQDLVVPEGPVALEGSQVTIHYHGTLTTGEVFDSTVERGQPITFALGAGEAPPGLDEGVLGMHLYGRRRLVAPYELMFPTGGPPELPTDSPLTIDVELIGLE